MINSLFKDSHITQPLWHSQKMYSGSGLGRGASPNERQSAGKEYSSVSVNNNIGISVNKPAKLSFRGLSDIHLAKEKIFKDFIIKIENSLNKALIKGKEDKKVIRTFVEDAVDFATGARSDVADNVKTFSTENKETIQTLLDHSKVLVGKDYKKPPEGSALTKAIKKTMGSAVNVLHTIDNSKSLYKSDKLKRLFENAGIYQVFFSAGFALLLTGLLRPATIMALPGQKKNKDDKKYASAQSISSGLIGFVLAFIVSTPISKACENFANSISGKEFYETDKDGNFKIDKDGKKITKKASLYLKNEESKNFFLQDTATLEKIYLKFKDDPDKVKKAEKEIAKLKARNDAAKNYANQAVDILMAAPKAMVTIALLPIILKYVFGLQKKKGNEKNMQPQQTQNYTALNFKSSNNNDRKIFKEFNGGVR